MTVKYANVSSAVWTLSSNFEP